jgi:hypothetical protein
MPARTGTLRSNGVAETLRDVVGYGGDALQILEESQLDDALASWSRARTAEARTYWNLFTPPQARPHGHGRLVQFYRIHVVYLGLPCCPAHSERNSGEPASAIWTTCTTSTHFTRSNGSNSVMNRDFVNYQEGTAAQTDPTGVRVRPVQ